MATLTKHSQCLAGFEVSLDGNTVRARLDAGPGMGAIEAHAELEALERPKDAAFALGLQVYARALMEGLDIAELPPDPPAGLDAIGRESYRRVHARLKLRPIADLPLAPHRYAAWPLLVTEPGDDDLDIDREMMERMGVLPECVDDVRGATSETDDEELCPTFPRAVEMAAEWARGHALPTEPDPHPELLIYARAFMLDRWGGEAIGSATTNGMQMAYSLGTALGILGDVRPVGMCGVLRLCEAAGWPKHPGPDDEPLPPIR